MSNKRKNRLNRKPRQGQAPQKGPVPSRHPSLAPNEEQISEIDFYKFRLSKQKLQTLNEKQSKIKMQQESLAKEQENLRLRVALMQSENKRDLGHLGNIDINKDNVGEKPGSGIFVLIRAQGAPGEIPVPPAPTAPKPLSVLKDDDEEDDLPEDGIESEDGDEDGDEYEEDEEEEEVSAEPEPEPKMPEKATRPQKKIVSAKKPPGSKKKKK